MKDSLSLEGRVALITGGGSGIGRASAIAFSEHGARLFLVDREAQRLIDIAEELRAKGSEIETATADIADAEQIKSAIDGCVERFGRLDILYANAGINGVWAPIEELTPEEFDETISVNVRGTFLTIKYAVPHLKAHGGSVLVTSSVNGTRTFSNSGATAYSASKAAQVAMVKMLAVELGLYRIRVNVICPGATQTNIGKNTESRGTERIKVPVKYPDGTSPLRGKTVGTSEQVGRLALFLVSDLADHITGEVVYIDAGSSLVVG